MANWWKFEAAGANAAIGVYRSSGVLKFNFSDTWIASLWNSPTPRVSHSKIKFSQQKKWDINSDPKCFTKTREYLCLVPNSFRETLRHSYTATLFPLKTIRFIDSSRRLHLLRTQKGALLYLALNCFRYTCVVRLFTKASHLQVLIQSWVYCLIM